MGSVQGDSDCEIEFYEALEKPKDELLHYSTVNTFSAQRRSISGSEPEAPLGILGTPKPSLSQGHRRKTVDFKDVLEDHMYAELTPSTVTSHKNNAPKESPNIQARLAVSLNSTDPSDEDPGHLLYNGAKTLLKHAQRIVSFCEHELEPASHSRGYTKQPHVFVGLFYRSWKRFLCIFERTKLFHIHSRLISYVVSFVKVSAFLILDSYPTEASSDIFDQIPLHTASLTAFLNHIDSLWIQLLDQSVTDVDNIIKDDTSTTAVKKILDTLDIELASDSFGPVITNPDEEKTVNTSSRKISSSLQESEWGFIDIHFLKGDISSLLQKDTTFTSFDFLVLPSETLNHIHCPSQRNVKRFIPHSPELNIRLSTVPCRVYLREKTSIYFKTTTKPTLPHVTGQSFRVNVVLPLYDFPSCRIDIEQHARMTLEVSGSRHNNNSKRKFSLHHDSCILLRRKSFFSQRVPGKTTKPNTEESEYVLIHVTLLFHQLCAPQHAPSTFSLSFTSIVRLSPPLEEKQRQYHAFLMRSRRYVYTLKANAMKAAKQVYGKSNVEPVMCLLDEFGTFLKALDTAQVLCDWFFRVCAFKEVFWCYSAPFHAVMPGDVVGYTWDIQDPHTSIFRDTLERFLQCLTENTLDEEFATLIPFHQRCKLIFFLSETLIRSAHRDLSKALAHCSRDPVWTFHNVEVRRLPFDDPRRPLRGRFGVFATSKIMENEIVGPYVGRVYSDFHDNLERSATPYLRTYIASREQYEMSIGGNLVIDSCTTGNRMNFVNDYRLAPDVCFLNSENRKNCSIKSLFSVTDGPEIPAFCASRDIDPGEELLADYGESYWSPENPATMKPYFYGAQDVYAFLKQTESTWTSIESCITPFSDPDSHLASY